MRSRRLRLAVTTALILLVVGGNGASALRLTRLVIVDTVCDVDLSTCDVGVQGLRFPHSLVVSPDGKHLYVVAALDDALTVYDRDAGSGSLNLIQSLFDTDAGIDGLDGARGVTMSPDGRHVYVAALVDSSLTVFARDAGTGLLTLIETEKDGAGGVNGLAGAHAVAVSPDGAHVYVASRSEDAVAVFSRNPGDGRVAFVEAEFENIGGVTGLDAAEGVTVSPDGRHVYVAGESGNALAAFSRNTSTQAPDFGKLTFVEAEIDGVAGTDGLDGANNVAVSPDGHHVYVASERGPSPGDWAAVFSRNDATGELTFVQALKESDFDMYAGCSGVGPANSGIAVSPDGRSVYLTNPYRGTVAWFERNAATGMLDLSTAICDLGFGLEGLAGAVAVAVNPSGSHLYVAAGAFETLTVLRVLQVPGDWNGDGQSDLVWRNLTTGEFLLWLMNGTTFSSVAPLPTLPAPWDVSAVEDFTQDGSPDFMLRNPGTGENSIWTTGSPSISGYVMLGPVGTEWTLGTAGDFSGDGQPDLLWRNTVTGENVMWRMDGLTFGQTIPVSQVTEVSWQIAGSGDFDLDGQRDLIWRNTSTNEVLLWLMDGALFEKAVSWGLVGPEWVFGGTGDYNSDGETDIVWRNNQNGQNLAWLMNGHQFQQVLVFSSVSDLNWMISGP